MKSVTGAQVVHLRVTTDSGRQRRHPYGGGVEDARLPAESQARFRGSHALLRQPARPLGRSATWSLSHPAEPDSAPDRLRTT